MFLTGRFRKVIIVLLVSLSIGAFSDHTREQKFIGREVEQIVPISSTENVNVFKVRATNFNFRITVTKNPINFAIKGSHVFDFSNGTDLEQFLRQRVSGNLDVANRDVETQGSVYTTYTFEGGNLIQNIIRFKSVKHLFNHLFEDILQCLNSSLCA